MACTHLKSFTMSMEIVLKRGLCSSPQFSIIVIISFFFQSCDLVYDSLHYLFVVIITKGCIATS